MEITIAWFWLIKLIFGSATVWVAYKAFIVYSFQRTSWNLLAFALFLLAYIQPFKMDVNTQAVTDRANTNIQYSKELPPKVDAPAFKHTPQPITTEDLQ